MIERAFVTLVEGQMHLRRLAGTDPEARPLLLCHASPSSSWGLQGLTQALAATGRRGTIVAPDTLGNGDSVGPAGEHPDIAYFADSKRRLIDALGKLPRASVARVAPGDAAKAAAITAFLAAEAA